jgi:predicted membrane protein
MKKHDIFWGLLFILAAALIIFNQFGYFTDVSMFDMVATFVLGMIIIKSIVRLNFWGVLFPLAFICILYADEWNITDFTPWPALFTALLFSCGFSLIFNKHSMWGFHCIHHHRYHNHASFSSNVVNEKDDSDIYCSSSFGECIKYVNTDNLVKANIKCSFGEVKVYFDNTLIPSGKADIYVDVSFGTVILFIPKSWKTTCKSHVFSGDMNDNDNFGSDAPVVTIHGNVSFGDIKVIYV